MERSNHYLIRLWNQKHSLRYHAAAKNELNVALEMFAVYPGESAKIQYWLTEQPEGTYRKVGRFLNIQCDRNQILFVYAVKLLVV